MKSVSNRLRKYGTTVFTHSSTGTNSSSFAQVVFEITKLLGLRYDDLYDPLYDLDIKEALNRMPREIVDARNQRLKRAMDLSMKHEYLPADLQVCVSN